MTGRSSIPETAVPKRNASGILAHVREGLGGAKASLDSVDSSARIAIIAEKSKTSREDMMLDTTSNAQVQVFLDKFEAALTAGDIDAAVAMFAPECYWR